MPLVVPDQCPCCLAERTGRVRPVAPKIRWRSVRSLIFILRYLESDPFRRRINTQLNKGEALHGLREFLLFAYKGVLRKKQEGELMNQASCLNLVTNAVVTWNTVYMAAVIEQLRAEGRTVNEEDIARLSRARFEHINPYGKYRFEVEVGLNRFRLRPLRQPTEHRSQ